MVAHCCVTLRSLRAVSWFVSAPLLENAQLTAENVGIQFHSLRQSFRDQLSPPASERAQKRNNHGPSHENLRTARRWLRVKILSLGRLSLNLRTSRFSAVLVSN
jgi:hypothetical protein